MLLSSGGVLPRYEPSGEHSISPRRKGVKQGALLMLIGAIVVPIFGVMSGFAPGRIDTVFAFFAAVSAIICFLGGPLRMLFAALFEEGAPTPQLGAPTSYGPPAITPPAARLSALPTGTVNPTTGWRARSDTAEIVHPPSVTDHTTRLLEKQDSKSDAE